MRLFDPTSGKLRQVDVRPRMTLYVCGITPYDAAHMGHAFTYTQFDVLTRYLRTLGTEVLHAENVTDVDDDILRTARERGVDYLVLAERETAAFEVAMRAINVAPTTFSPRATQYVEAMIEEVWALQAAGHAYERAGTVYFRVASDPEYGRLSGLDPLDFVLWQRSEEGEPKWASPWGDGRPGWHIECSTMAKALLGQPVDIHGGGSDLIFPHHESELVQAEGVPGAPKPFVRHWMHTGMVFQGDDKMSKSLGNLVFVRELLERYAGTAIRSYLLRHHYRQDWQFREEDFKGYVQAACRMKGGPEPLEVSKEAVVGALGEDLDTPLAMAIVDWAEDGGLLDVAAAGREVLGLDF